MTMRTDVLPATSAPVNAAESSLHAGSRLLSLQVLSDTRGTLSFGEVGKPLPFTPVRYFTISSVPAGSARGGHAHRECHQFLVCLAGSCIAELDDGQNNVEVVVLSDLGWGLHLVPLTWISLRDFSRDAVLLVLASHSFDEADYLREYGGFLDVVRNARP